MHELTKIHNLFLITIFTSLMAATMSPAAQNNQLTNYRSLAELLHPDVQPKDYIALTGYEKGYEKSIGDASREFFNSHPELVQQIRRDLGSQEIHWHLQRLSHRLVYKPETRKEVAVLFTNYCREAVEDLLARTGLTSPYSSISALVDETPDLDAEQGIKAYIVQNLAQEYMARYQFRGTSKNRIEIDLSGLITVNEVGSYSSYILYSDETHNWEFTRSRHTVWKSASANPYTVLVTPLEETLHIALRKHTEKAIKQAAIFKDKIPSMAEVSQLVNDWLAVEEAIVGGLVYKLAPQVVIRRVPDLPMALVRADLETKTHFEKYRFLPKAIELVENFGLKESIQFYARDPIAFRALLTAPG